MNISEYGAKVRAYEIWCNNGCQFGQERENYFQALSELNAEILDKIETIVVKSLEEVDKRWYVDIEEMMPEIKTKKFPSVHAKISWMLNNLKSYKHAVPVHKQHEVY